MCDETLTKALLSIQACQLFMSVAVEQAGIDYHVVLAQNALQQCLDQPELQSEFICALVKQTSRHTQHRLGVQVKKAARLVSLGTARVVSPAYCLTNTLNPVPFSQPTLDSRRNTLPEKSRISFSLPLYLSASNRCISVCSTGTLVRCSQIILF